MKQTHKLFIILGVLGLFIVFFALFSSNKPQKIETGTKPLPGATESIKIVAFGDSLTAGYNLPEKESYPALLETRLRDAGYSVQVINSGVSGETTRGEP